MERKSNKKSNLHAGHRSRMRKRFESDGFDAFSDHECIEFLLYNTMKRVNTNEIAHDLINRFGSVSGVLNAPYDQLVEIDGIGDVTAKYIVSLNSKITDKIIGQLSGTGEFNKHNAAVTADWIMGTADSKGRIPIIVCNSSNEITDILYADVLNESTGLCDIRKLSDFLIDNDCKKYCIFLHDKDLLDKKSAQALRIFTDTLGCEMIDTYYFAGQKPISIFETL